MPAYNLRFGAMATCLRRNEMEIKDITLDSVATNRNAATSPSRWVVIGKPQSAVSNDKKTENKNKLKYKRL